jgi:hypothetical protein
MYSAFRENKQSLPGDEEILKNQKPSMKVYLYPFKSDQPNLILPKLNSPQLILQPIISIEALKKYLGSKFNDNPKASEISILYKNQDIPDYYTLKDVEKIFSFNTDKTVLHYMRKSAPTNEEINNV